MPGNRNSGRKGYKDELTSKRILDAASNIILWTLQGKGIWADIDNELRLEVAKAIVVKAMPSKVEGEGLSPSIINIFRSNTDGSEVKALPRPVHIQRSPVSGNGIGLGNGQVDVRHTPGDDPIGEIPE